ncbi:MAG: GTP cyclohydrolase II [Alphaproteobacteria bacterium]|nr:GTP cyclohydrolase II [Alphaproteobacteria bacterium]
MEEAAPVNETLRAVERAVDALRAGKPVRLADAEPVTAIAAEFISDEALSALRAVGPADLLLTHHRAATLHLRLYTPEIVAVPVDAMSARELRALIDPSDDLSHPFRGPFTTRREALPVGYGGAVRLAKLAGLLPAVVAVRGAGAAAASVSTAAVENYEVEAANALKAVTEARVPLAGSDTARIVGFRPSDGGAEHLAILVGDPSPPGPVLVRLHSECFTGDLLGSLKCDCGDQLRGAVRLMAEAQGGGVLLYLAQEGRGIGLMNKLRAYRLQEQGFDTIEANRRLGFEDDERNFLPAATMLRKLGFTKIRLLTNNPAKAEGLARFGLEIVERVPHSFPDNPHNSHYLAVKRDKAGHDL